eukprot:3921156-Pyramimonas_sp.AAC.1
MHATFSGKRKGEGEGDAGGEEDEECHGRTCSHQTALRPLGVRTPRRDEATLELIDDLCENEAAHATQRARGNTIAIGGRDT